MHIGAFIVGVKTFITKHFSRFLDGSKSTSSNIAASKAITSELVGYLTQLSDFANMKDEEVQEQLYVWEPEVGGSFDRISTLIRQSFAGYYVKDAGMELDAGEKRMIELANELEDTVDYNSMRESLSEMLLMFGNVFILNNDDLSLTILPNKYCAILDEDTKMGTTSTSIIMNPKYLAFNELGLFELDRRLYPMERITHLKYKSTPIFVKDNMGRETYGIYSVSPLTRTFISVWWKRQCQIIDVLLRWRNVPREHHQINAELFPLSMYPGTTAERQAAANADIDSFISRYINSLKSQMPDQGVVSTDNVKIGMIESKVNYLQSNELIAQLDSTIMAGLNVPQSMVNSSQAGSYASELVISNYVSSKVIQLAEKIKPVILNNIRARIKLIDPTLPVDRLDMKLELNLANSKLELWRTAAIMGSLGIFTDSEVRDMLGYEPLRADQRNFLINTSANTSSQESVANAVKGGSDRTPDYPETSESDVSHVKDEGENVYRTM